MFRRFSLFDQTPPQQHASIVNGSKPRIIPPLLHTKSADPSTPSVIIPIVSATPPMNISSSQPNEDYFPSYQRKRSNSIPTPPPYNYSPSLLSLQQRYLPQRSSQSWYERFSYSLRKSFLRRSSSHVVNLPKT